MSARVADQPDQPIILQNGSRLSYRQLYDRTLWVASHMAARGIRPGDPVALLLQNTPASVIAYLALSWVGAGIIPLNADIPASGIVSLRRDIAFTAITGHVGKLQLLEEALGSHVSTYLKVEDLLNTETPALGGLAHTPATYDKPFLYHFTSGSTGRPKAALHSQEALIAGAHMYRNTFGISSQDGIVAAVPLLHSFGMVAGLVTALLTGAQLILIEKPAPHRLLQMLAQEEAATILLGTPLLYDLMARAHVSNVRLDSLRLCLSSGEPLRSHVARSFTRQYRAVICQVYGSTEAGIISAQLPAEKTLEFQSSVGRPVAGVRARIVDDQGKVVPTGAMGNLLVQTPGMFGGYLLEPEATAAAFQDGWYFTGDIGWQDEDHQLHLVGRKDTFINIGGRKVNPLDVENVLLAHPSIEEAAAWGAVGYAGQHEVRAAVVTSEALSMADLSSFCRKHLLPYQVPKRIEFLTAIPRSVSGKVRRSEIDTR